MGAERLFGYPMGPAYRLLRGIPVRNKGGNRTAFREAGLIIQTDWVIGIFPEGIKSPAAELLPAYKGAALLAAINNAHILPVGIAGTEQVRNRMRTWPLILRRPKVKITVGKAFKLPAESNPTRDQLTSFTEIVMARIAELLPEGYQGNYRTIKNGN